MSNVCEHLEIKRASLRINPAFLPVNCANCKHGLCLSRRIYCSVLREKVDDSVSEYCPYFEPEPLEYKLFKRA